MKNISTKVVLSMAFGIALLAPFGVLAQANPIGTIESGGAGVGLGGYTGVTVGANELVEKIVTLVNWFAWFVALASVVMGLYAGFLFITARGETSQLTTARQTLVWAVIGIAVAIISFSIILLTRTIFGIE